MENIGNMNLLENRDVHIHFPAGAVPKDGPSAGVTLVTSLVSLFTQRTVRSDTTMTGELTLRGLVLPVGGIKDKVWGIDHMIILCIIVSFWFMALLKSTFYLCLIWFCQIYVCNYHSIFVSGLLVVKLVMITYHKDYFSLIFSEIGWLMIRSLMSQDWNHQHIVYLYNKWKICFHVFFVFQFLVHIVCFIVVYLFHVFRY